MNRKSTSKIADDLPIRASDIASGKLILRKRNPSGAIATGKQRVNIYLDAAIVQHFKTEAGERGYQTRINEALKAAIQTATIEETIRQTIRQELRAFKT